jgi:mono/diheme cytochrome c family protein
LGLISTVSFFLLAFVAAVSQQPTSGPMTFARTATRLDRGRYLANGPAHCFNCHAELQGDGRIGNLPIPGREGSGNVVPNGPRFPNITSDEETGIGRWTDADVLRAIREGIRPDGRVLSTRMPWNVLSALTAEDAASVVVYIRSLKPIRKEIPPLQETPDVVESRAATLAFEPAVKPTFDADLRTTLGRGAYLVKVSHCMNCHTPIDEHSRRIPGLTFGGGIGPNGLTGNITQDPSGIPYYDEKVFIETIRSGKVANVRELQSGMLWRFYAQMTDDDLKAIFAYIKTVPAVKHRVNTTDEPTLCPVCKRKHGLGDRNVAPTPAK